jgi:hypothetical protein
MTSILIMQGFAGLSLFSVLLLVAHGELTTDGVYTFFGFLSERRLK